MIRKLILLVLFAMPAAAQDAQLFIERIEVRNHKRVSPDVILAESRLREGREYSEADLRDASTRLGRLPFLLSVDFALEKGSERGKHVLVLTVHETKPFFFLLSAVPYFDPQDGPLTADDDIRSPGGSGDLALGFRWFVGRRGALHVGLAGGDRNREFSREYGAFAVGYTQYDLFGTRAFATLNLKRPIVGSGTGKVSPQLVAGIPLAANQTVTLEYDEARFTHETTGYDSGYGQRIVSARWAHNTTNEPFFPTRGALVHAGPVVGWVDGSTRYSNGNGIEVSYATHSRFYGLEGGAARYFELSDRDSVWADFRADWLHNDVRAEDEDFDESTNYASIGAGYSHSLWSAEERANGDSRFELTARFANRSRYSDPDYVIRQRPDRRVSQVAGAWVRRSSWGTLRLGVGYAW